MNRLVVAQILTVTLAGAALSAACSTATGKSADQATADARLQSFAALTAGWVLAVRGDVEQALKACQRSLDAARDPVSVAGAKCFQGYAHLEMGSPGQAIALLEESVATCARIGLRQSQARGLVFLSHANLALGKIDQAREQATRGRAMHRDMKAAWGEALATQALGRIALTTGALEQADADLRQASTMFRTIGAKFEIARTAVDLARLAHTRRRRADASALLQEARDEFRALGAPQHVERVEALAHRLGARLQ